ncbi:lipocalin-like domain-containing protein [Phenylobacterium sp. LjRoot219]|uniref:lipocalin-like domain-containing protein n=1 Tax=Phenylobacterium sp. LjRoot219 TaxID=3342283 RepID=UPI003ED07EB3
METIAIASLHGCWDLASWRRIGPDGGETYPYTRSARGRLIYEPGGRMAVFLMRPDWGEASVADGFIAYSGRFETRPGEIHHLIDLASQKPLVDLPQVRQASFVDGVLRLAAPGRDDPTARHELDWRRADG